MMDTSAQFNNRTQIVGMKLPDLLQAQRLSDWLVILLRQRIPLFSIEQTNSRTFQEIKNAN